MIKRVYWIEYNRGVRNSWGVYRQVGDVRAWIASFATKDEAKAWIKKRTALRVAV